MNSLDGALRVRGHNQPGVLLSEAAQRLLPKVRAHFLSVLASARLAHDDWGVVGPKRDELLAEWRELRITARAGRAAGQASASVEPD
jgi:hypothetical protein